MPKGAYSEYTSNSNKRKNTACGNKTNASRDHSNLPKKITVMLLRDRTYVHALACPSQPPASTAGRASGWALAGTAGREKIHPVSPSRALPGLGTIILSCRYKQRRGVATAPTQLIPHLVLIIFCADVSPRHSPCLHPYPPLPHRLHYLRKQSPRRHSLGHIPPSQQPFR